MKISQKARVYKNLPSEFSQVLSKGVLLYFWRLASLGHIWPAFSNWGMRGAEPATNRAG